MKMKDIQEPSLTLKSNVTLKSREVILPMDNVPVMKVDVRYRNTLTEAQKKQLDNMLFYVEEIVNENNERVEVKCFKGCENCGKINNNCRRPQNNACK